jgi:hypothetical protein
MPFYSQLLMTLRIVGWRPKLEKTLSSCKAVAIFVGSCEMGSWQQREVDVALDLQSRRPVLADLSLGSVLPKADTCVIHEDIEPSDAGYHLRCASRPLRVLLQGSRSRVGRRFESHLFRRNALHHANGIAAKGSTA